MNALVLSIAGILLGCLIYLLLKTPPVFANLEGRRRWRDFIGLIINRKLSPGWPLYLRSISASVRCTAAPHVGLLAIFVLLFHPSIALAQPTGRNILFIVADDMRTWVNYDDNFSGRYLTPNLDQLAAESTRYRTAYATIPKCLGSRTSVMMGMSPPTHGLGYNRNLGYFDGGWPYLLIYQWSSYVSLPEALTGYYTAVTGKVFHSPLPDKWDESGPTPIMRDYYNPQRPGPDNTFFYAEEITEEDDNPDQRIADWASNFVQTYSGAEPFFLAVGLNLPHQPLRVPSWYYSLYSGVTAPTPFPNDLDDEPAEALLRSNNYQHELIVNAGKADYYTQAYLAGISHTDAMLGQVLDALENSSYANNTDVVFLSDHGYHLGEKLHWRKQTFWEEAAKVPLLVRGPDYPPGDVFEPVSLLDVAPTVMDLAGLTKPAQFEGAPLRDAANRSPVEIYWYEGKATVANGLKVVDYNSGKPPGLQDFAAYDLTLDPQEHENIIADLDPATLDLDHDGLVGAVESSPGIGTDPLNADSDNDGLNDGDEVNYSAFPADTYSIGIDTNPLLADTDGDGHTDGEEVATGHDPLSAADFPPPPPAC